MASKKKSTAGKSNRERLPHEMLFQKLMEDPALAESFLRGVLPESITSTLDFGTLQRKGTTTVTEQLKGGRSDLLFELTQTNGTPYQITVLVEHKSAPAPLHIRRQLMRYMWGEWAPAMAEGEYLTPTWPVVFYHSKEPWEKQPFDLEVYGRQLPEAWQSRIPAFDYELANIAHWDDREIETRFQHPVLRLGMLVMKWMQWATHPGEWLQWVPRLLGLDSEERYRKSIRAIFVYWHKKYQKLNGDMATLEKTITAHQPKPVDWTDYFEAMKQLDFEEGKLEGKKEGKLEGKKEGKREGKIEGKIEDAQRMLADNLPVAKVLLYTGLSQEDIAHLL